MDFNDFLEVLNEKPTQPKNAKNPEPLRDDERPSSAKKKER